MEWDNVKPEDKILIHQVSSPPGTREELLLPSPASLQNLLGIEVAAGK